MRSIGRAGQMWRWPRLAVILLMTIGIWPLGVAAQSDADDGVATLTGSVEIPPDQLAAFSEPYVMLIDINALLGSGQAPSLPSQIAAGLEADDDTFTFSLALPIQPVGIPVNVAGPDTDEMPLVYSIDVVSNITGTPFLEEADFYGGIPSLFSSIGFAGDDLNGQLAVWSDGDGAEFATGAGDDGEALTGDDPTDRLDAGWTIVDISESPYDWGREAEQEIGFPEDLISPNDFSEDSWTDAFDALVDQLEAEYAFTDVKEIDFAELRETYGPMVQAAEQDDDLDAYTLAIYQFSLEFGDGHVGATRPVEWFTETYGGSFGLTLGQADDGEIYVVEIADGGPAEEAGIERGDIVTGWDGDDIQAHLNEMTLPRSVSSDVERANKLVRWVTRGPIDSSIEVAWTDADGDEQRGELTATDDPEGLSETIRPIDLGNVAAMPIESEVLDSGAGYIRINTFATDLVLFAHQWDYALRTFEALGVSDLIVDVRANGGGYSTLSFYATASFVDEPFVIDEAYLPDGDGTYSFAYDEYAAAGPDRWEGDVAVIVDDDCKSSCELFAGTMAAIEDDAIAIVGHTPSAGVYAAIQQWTLPEGLYFQASYVRFELDGDLYLEEVGVPLDVDVPVTQASLLSPEDEVLESAERAVRGKSAGPARG